MNNILRKLFPVLVLLQISYANAGTFEPTFSDYPFPGTVFVVDSAANDFFSEHYGIRIENSYLYKDSRDAFDGIGVANGASPESDFIVGTIWFLDTTDLVSVDYLSILESTYRTYNASNTLLQEFSNLGDDENGTYVFNSGTIARLDFFSRAYGYATVTGLRYDYDGFTDGNCDIESCEPSTDVPLPATLSLFGLGLAGLGWSRRKKA